MKRDIIKNLSSWACSASRVPLVLRGARQVGKSWVIKEFGKQFEYFIELNFEKNKSIKQAFQGDIDIPQLLEKISLYTGIPVIPGKTLLFLDEIQECPEAIIYLRYFKEENSELHIVAAGSLLEFALEKVGIPVGRVEYLYLMPLSFGEFLTAQGRDDLRQRSLNKNNDAMLDGLLKDLLRTYMWLGGMPEVVNAWIAENSIQTCLNIQDRVITAYQDDFLKYAKKYQIHAVEQVFNAIPLQFGKKFVYAHVDNELRATVLKSALFLLEKASIATLCYYTSAQKPPLAAGINEKYFKAFFVDIGLSQRILRLEHKDWIINPIQVEHLGGIAEQFVAQELLAYQSNHVKAKLFYWMRESKNSLAEIDFLISNHYLIPIEVKAGKFGRLKSLRTYLNEHPHTKYGVKISEQAYGMLDNLLQVPLYGIEKWLEFEKEQ